MRKSERRKAETFVRFVECQNVAWIKPRLVFTDKLTQIKVPLYCSSIYITLTVIFCVAGNMVQKVVAQHAEESLLDKE